MPYCPKCGNKVDDGAAFCQNCGAKLNTSRTDFSDELKRFTDTPDSTSQYDPRDIADNKVMGVLCYLGLLWLVPLLAAKNSPFVKFHLNQGLLVLIIALASSILNWIPIINIFGWIVSVIAFAFAIIGIVHVCQGKAQELGGIAPAVAVAPDHSHRKRLELLADLLGVRVVVPEVKHVVGLLPADDLPHPVQLPVRVRKNDDLHSRTFPFFLHILL